MTSRYAFWSCVTDDKNRETSQHTISLVKKPMFPGP